jgi:hypothetical protein
LSRKIVDISTVRGLGPATALAAAAFRAGAAFFGLIRIHRRRLTADLLLNVLIRVKPEKTKGINDLSS